MTLSNSIQGKGIGNKEKQELEDDIARQLRIMDEASAIMVTIDNADLLEAIAGRIARIIECAGETRRSLITLRNGREPGGEL